MFRPSIKSETSFLFRSLRAHLGEILGSDRAGTVTGLSNVSFFHATYIPAHLFRITLPLRPVARLLCIQLSMVVTTLFEPIIQPSIGPFSELAFKAALAAQSGKIACPRSGNHKPGRLDLAVLDGF
jgi:hypothetical protein